jgi:putrescine transport system ATP-binding protein
MTDELQTTDVQPAANGSLLQIASVTKRFGTFVAVDRLSLDIKAGEFFALLGPSGCGKTTLLRMLAGFDVPDEGRLLLDGRDIGPVLPHRRPVNMMFQNYALFPHLSVSDNIAFGLRRLALPKPEIDARVKEMLALTRLEGLEARKPDQLSGGQRQRVALARSLARRPKILLLDEPMAALDKKLRENTQAELMDVQRRLGTTFIIVTHDQDEAMTVADRIGVMDRGRLVQVATPREIYEAPNSRWIAGFVGDVNMIEGRVVSNEYGRLVIATQAAGSIVTGGRPEGLAGQASGEAVCVAVRPEKIRLINAGEDISVAVDANNLAGEVIDINYLGGASIYRVRLESGLVLRVSVANASRRAVDAIAAGDHVTVSFAPEDCVVLEQ